jgi:hypothetical protein
MTLEYSGIERRLDDLSERLGRLEPLRARTVAARWNVVVGADVRQVVSGANSLSPSGTPPQVFGHGQASTRTARVIGVHNYEPERDKSAEEPSTPVHGRLSSIKKEFGKPTRLGYASSD